ncbi:glycosyltransferase [Microbacterium ulmi]|uniref:Glycosyltransferase n=1 Tax=Microbacterium ulmi TaxID=179095 RepID=A0A7Y2LZ12_9MICO|nr:nucleotide disphospho-sugar-binding domain-containing protein [Microbacterium ulmi]NII69646.1 MGT family glycosyltransferase [Microbacterium ulmi]NNH03466.1 glycosyltransferase [Microbacterium ulmi]
MARIMLEAMPFTGHVTPIAAVASELVARGNDVRFYTGSAFQGRVEASGARFVPWRVAPDFDENDMQATFPRLVGKKGLGQLLINVADVMIGTAPAQVDDLRSEWEREPWDVIAMDELSVGAAFFAEQRGGAWATVSVLPLNLSGTSGPPSGMGLAPGTNVVTRTRDAALRALVPMFSRPLTKPLARARAAVGLPPATRTFDQTVFSPALVVASGVPLLDFERPDRPPHVQFVGELAHTTRAAQPEVDPPPWWGDLDGRTVVHVTQGTFNIDPTNLLRPALEALADVDAIVVATSGVPGRDSLPFPVPRNARVAGFVPYARLLPRVDVVVTNGGWGGVLAALAHDIPLVIAGGDLDKPEIAARVAWARAGVNLRTGTPTAAQVRAGFDRVAGDRSFRDAAARVGAQLRSLGGAPRAAELIEALAPP